MANVIRLKNSGTVSGVPTSLAYGEIAINYADGILFYKNASDAIVSFNITEAIGNASLDDTIADLEVSLSMQTF